MRSWWEQRHAVRHDVVVVGGGLVGLSAALALRDLEPKAGILVVDRGLLPTGATTRSAGFACLGGLGELVDDVDAHGLEATAELVLRRQRGLEALRRRLGDAAIGYRPSGGWELITAEQAPWLDRLDELDAALRPALGGPALVRDDARLARFGFGHTAHLVRLPHEGALDPGLLLRALHARARAADVAVWTGAPVRALTPGPEGVRLDLADPVGTDLTLHADRVAVCTNAFATSLVPELPIRPGRGQVLVTEPVGALPFSGVFHRDAGYVYFRDVEGRVLLGGARHLDVDGETSTELALHPVIQDHLVHLLRTVVLPGREVAITHRWAGVMAFGPERAPIVQTTGPVVVGARLGGMGIALGTEVGAQVAAHLTALR